MRNGKLLHPIVGSSEMAWIGESIGCDCHRMFVPIPVEMVIKVRTLRVVSDELTLERSSAGTGQVSGD